MKRNRPGRPKKGEGEILRVNFTFYQNELDLMDSLSKKWRLNCRTDVIRKALMLAKDNK